MIWTTLRIAVAEIRRNFTRSILTALGILIGVGAVIAMVGVGQGATAAITDDLSSIGSNLLVAMPGTGKGPAPRTPAPAFTTRDATAIEGQIAHVVGVAPTTTVPATVVAGSEELTTSITGSTRAWFAVMDRHVADGRLPTEGEERAGAAVCVLGASVADTLFGGENPVGADIRMASTSCEVIGVVQAKGANTMGMDQDDFVYTPLSTAQRRLAGTSDVASIYVSVDRADHIDRAKADLEALLRQRRHIAEGSTDNFQIHDTREMAQMVTGVTSTLTAFLGAVAGISLLVGGIGIMNIMLVSVTERTREIGIRMAIGAQEHDVMTQFLVEAGLLSALGGVIGVAVGLLGSWSGALAIGVPFVFDPLIVVGAVVFSALVGVAFGWYPARRAAQMEPIDALRHT